MIVGLCMVSIVNGLSAWDDPFTLLSGGSGSVTNNYYNITNSTTNNITNNNYYNVSDSSFNCSSANSYIWNVSIVNGVITGQCDADSTGSTTYSAGLGLNLTGTEFSINQTYLDSRYLNGFLKLYFYNVTSPYNSSYTVMNTTVPNSSFTMNTSYTLSAAETVLATRLFTQANISVLQEGVYKQHTTINHKTSGSKNVRLHSELYVLRLNNTWELVGTATPSTVLVENTYQDVEWTGVIGSEVSMANGEYIIMQLNATLSGGGSNPQIDLVVGGTTGASLELGVAPQFISLIEYDPYYNADKTALQNNNTLREEEIDWINTTAGFITNNTMNKTVNASNILNPYWYNASNPSGYISSYTETDPIMSASNVTIWDFMTQLNINDSYGNSTLHAEVNWLNTSKLNVSQINSCAYGQMSSWNGSAFTCNTTVLTESDPIMTASNVTIWSFLTDLRNNNSWINSTSLSNDTLNWNCIIQVNSSAMQYINEKSGLKANITQVNGSAMLYVNEKSGLQTNDTLSQNEIDWLNATDLKNNTNITTKFITQNYSTGQEIKYIQYRVRNPTLQRNFTIEFPENFTRIELYGDIEMNNPSALFFRINKNFSNQTHNYRYAQNGGGDTTVANQSNVSFTGSSSTTEFWSFEILIHHAENTSRTSGFFRSYDRYTTAGFTGTRREGAFGFYDNTQGNYIKNITFYDTAGASFTTQSFVDVKAYK